MTGVADAPKRLVTAFNRSAGGETEAGVESGKAADKAKRGVLMELSGAGRGARANSGYPGTKNPRPERSRVLSQSASRAA